MIEEIIKHLLLSLSLCADCFAVALCAGVSMRNLKWKDVIGIALVFAVIHVLFMSAGWLFGGFIVRYVMQFMKWIGMGLLVFVGCMMIRDAFRENEEAANLNGFRNTLMAASADSIDALAVGVSMSMAEQNFSEILDLVLILFCVTVAVVATGLRGGSFIGRRAGRPASVAGGAVLILLGLNVLLDVF